MRREELLKSDLISEVILLVASVLVFLILLLILVVALTQPSALAFSAPIQAPRSIRYPLEHTPRAGRRLDLEPGLLAGFPGRFSRSFPLRRVDRQS